MAVVACGGGEPTVRGRRVSSLYKVRATSIIISREPRQDGALDWQTHPPPRPPTSTPLSRANRVIIQTISYFLLFPCPYREPSRVGSPPVGDDRRVPAARSRDRFPTPDENILFLPKSRSAGSRFRDESRLKDEGHAPPGRSFN